MDRLPKSSASVNRMLLIQKLLATCSICPKCGSETSCPKCGPPEDWRPVPLDELCRVHINRVLKHCNGEKLLAAKVLGIGKSTLYRHLRIQQEAPAPGPTALDLIARHQRLSGQCEGGREAEEARSRFRIDRPV
jgi:hypothetical protein